MPSKIPHLKAQKVSLGPAKSWGKPTSFPLLVWPTNFPLCLSVSAPLLYFWRASLGVQGKTQETYQFKPGLGQTG